MSKKPLYTKTVGCKITHEDFTALQKKQEEKLHMRKGGLTKEKLPESVEKGQTRDKVASVLGVSGRQLDKECF